MNPPSRAKSTLQKANTAARRQGATDQVKATFAKGGV